ncbi:neutral zinc metallopeptidase [Geodermatophilus sp. SYSU D00684]
MPAAARPRRPAAGVLLVAGVLAAGCTAVVPGTASPTGTATTDATDVEVQVHLAEEGDPADRLARNAVADVLAWWERTYPEVFGGRFGAIEGGFWSVDPAETDPAALPDGACFPDDVDDLADNAFYCGDDDAVVYDRAWLADLVGDYGPFIVAEIMAHEISHAVQAQAGLDDPSIVAETQAECFAGAWTKWVVTGRSEHFAVRPKELDPYLLGYLYFGDAVGTSPDAEDAHGSLFDQLSAFQEGYADGPEACAAFDESRLYTQQEVSPRAGGHDRSYRAVVDGADDVLAGFWQQALTRGFPGTDPLGGPFAAPEVRAADGPGAVCTGEGAELDLQFCPEDGSVRYDAADLLEPAFDDVGDFAVTTLLGLPYAMAVREQRGLSVDDPEAVTSAVCATGWLAREAYLGALDGAPVALSPGDVDEAAVVLLQYATEPTVVPEPDLSGFELVDSFRQGFADGGDACGL